MNGTNDRKTLAEMLAELRTIIAEVNRDSAELSARLNDVMALYELEARGLLAETAARRPFEALAAAGKLPATMRLLEELAQKPEYVDHLLELIQ